jgi:hypothetical protein
MPRAARTDMLRDVPDPYREPPPDRRRTPLEEPPGDAAGPHTAALASVAGLAGAGALLIGHAELVALVGAGALAVGAHLWRAARGRGRTDELELFLGDTVIEGAGAWTSIDGAHRLRSVAHDRRPRWERLDPRTGETLASHRAAARAAPPAVPLHVLDRRAARVFGRPRRPRCYLTPPAELAPAVPIVAEPSWVVLLVHRDGILLERRDHAGRLLGDTLHEHVDEALRALSIEHPEGVGAWQSIERGVPASARAVSWDEPASRLPL